MVRKRRAAPGASEPLSSTPSSPDPSANMSGPGGDDVSGSGLPVDRSARTQWIFFAVASGACAAFNGVFAKLTTTGLTTKLATGIASFFGLSSLEKIVEIAVRGIFFALNLTFNGIMWSLFTTALARGTSTTQVSILNTSTNFILTALLGGLIFSEALPPLWWAGASMLVAGSVIVGRKDEASKDAPGAESGYAHVPQEGEDDLGRRKDDDDGGDDERDEDVIDLGDLSEERR